MSGGPAPSRLPGMLNLPTSVRIVEQSPRDGLQDVKDFVPTQKKAALIRMLARSGVAGISVTSFVHPKWVPQMADAEDLLKELGPAPKAVVYSAVTPNEKALLRVLELPEEIRPGRVAVPFSASETFQRRNVNRTTDETLREIGRIVALAHKNHLEVSSAVSMAFGCPYEGDVPASAVVRAADALWTEGIRAIGLADTTGTSNPLLVKEICGAVTGELPEADIGLHIHDSRGMGLACVMAALEVGVTRFDGSAAGIGGCPYAKGARGNIATEDLVHMLHEMGIHTGVDLEEILQAAGFIDEELGLPVAGQVYRAGPVRHDPLPDETGDSETCA